MEMVLNYNPKPDLEVESKWTETPLCLHVLRVATRKGSSLGMVEALLRHGANIDTVRSNNANTIPLVLIQENHNDHALVLLLLHYGLKIGSDQFLQFWKACFDNDTDSIRSHVQPPSGFVRPKQAYIELVFFILVVKNHVEGVKLLLDDGVSPNIQYLFHRSPLHYAVCIRKNGAEMVRTLLGYGANTEIRDDFGLTPLLAIAACPWAEISVLDILLDHGARYEDRTRFVWLTSNVCYSPIEFAVALSNRNDEPKSVSAMTAAIHNRLRELDSKVSSYSEVPVTTRRDTKV